MKVFLSLTIICLLPLLIVFGRSDQNSQEKSGKYLFNSYCSNCHGVNSTKTGPPFQHVRQVRGKDWVYRFMRIPGALVFKDSMSVRMVRKFKGQVMPGYALTPAQIDAICDYVDSFPFNAASKDYDYRKG